MLAPHRMRIDSLDTQLGDLLIVHLLSLDCFDNQTQYPFAIDAVVKLETDALVTTLKNANASATVTAPIVSPPEPIPPSAEGVFEIRFFESLNGTYFGTYNYGKVVYKHRHVGNTIVYKYLIRDATNQGIETRAYDVVTDRAVPTNNPSLNTSLTSRGQRSYITVFDDNAQNIMNIVIKDGANDGLAQLVKNAMSFLSQSDEQCYATFVGDPSIDPNQISYTPFAPGFGSYLYLHLVYSNGNGSVFLGFLDVPIGYTRNNREINNQALVMLIASQSKVSALIFPLLDLSYVLDVLDSQSQVADAVYDYLSTISLIRYTPVKIAKKGVDEASPSTYIVSPLFIFRFNQQNLNPVKLYFTHLRAGNKTYLVPNLLNTLLGSDEFGVVRLGFDYIDHTMTGTYTHYFYDLYEMELNLDDLGSRSTHIGDVNGKCLYVYLDDVTDVLPLSQDISFENYAHETPSLPAFNQINPTLSSTVEVVDRSTLLDTVRSQLGFAPVIRPYMLIITEPYVSVSSGLVPGVGFRWSYEVYLDGQRTKYYPLSFPADLIVLDYEAGDGGGGGGGGNNQQITVTLNLTNLTVYRT